MLVILALFRSAEIIGRPLDGALHVQTECQPHFKIQ